MPLTVFLVVILAAGLHASWNALVKTGGDPELRLALVGLVISAMMLPLCLLVPPPPAAAWPWLLGSLASHLFYYELLARAYRLGDLSQVYPVTRGLAPPVAALLAWLILGEGLEPAGVAAVVVIGLGIVALAAAGPGGSMAGRRALVPAVMNACVIGGYTICDGMGARTAGDAWSYVVWLFALDGLPFGALVLARRQGVLLRAVPLLWRPAALAGAMSLSAYALVIWAMTKAPIAYVSALRETSVVLAAWMGTRLLHEPFGRRRIACAALVALGVAALQLSRVH
ncbi:MAG TPA: DMT family transporter [Geminicoccus sp.]|uniref:DMT family transporter n=1 Tax=Geminicoccus sp. TaxID=2024832 RepID=UPI002C2E92F0|nr:DMT family transporter [Geminicoccus sp.]HWL69498.1 DMT family transporter [Geminicoccus sp.]